MNRLRIALISATEMEIAPFRKMLLDQGAVELIDRQFTFSSLDLEIILSGPGLVSSTFHIAQALMSGKYDLFIQAGIAGTYSERFAIGDVVHVIQESIGDCGAIQKDYSFATVFDLGIDDPDRPPFSKGVLINQSAGKYKFLPSANGVTVNTSSSNFDRARQLSEQFGADVETMEGASFFYCCLIHQVQFIELRAISNMAGERDKSRWDIDKAINQLAVALLDLVKNLEEIDFSHS